MTCCLKDLLKRIEALESSAITKERLGVVTQQEDDCWLSVTVGDGPNPAIESSNGIVGATVSTSGGSGNNGAGRIYTLTFPAHPLGADFSQSIQVWDDTTGDTGIAEVVSKTATSLTYQFPQGDDGASEDDNDFYKHDVKIFGTNQSFVSAVTVGGVAI